MEAALRVAEEAHRKASEAAQERERQLLEQADVAAQRGAQLEERLAIASQQVRQAAQIREAQESELKEQLDHLERLHSSQLVQLAKASEEREKRLRDAAELASERAAAAEAQLAKASEEHRRRVQELQEERRARPEPKAWKKLPAGATKVKPTQTQERGEGGAAGGGDRRASKNAPSGGMCRPRHWRWKGALCCTLLCIINVPLIAHFLSPLEGDEDLQASPLCPDHVDLP